MKKEKFDIEIAIERLIDEFSYADIITRIEEFEYRINHNIMYADEDETEYEEDIYNLTESINPEDKPQFLLIKEMTEWYEKTYGKLTKKEKELLKNEICYHYEIEIN